MATAKSKTPPVPVKREIGKDLLKLVDLMHEEKKISRDVIFSGIEAAILLAAQKHFAVEEGVDVHIDRATGDIHAKHGDIEIDPETLGRIAAQSAKQAMISKIREAESDTVFNEYTAKKGEMLVGTITRIDAGTAIVSLGKSEALLPRSEQIPGQTHHVGERVQATVLDVRRAGQRVKIVLSRCHPDFVRSLFEEEIPEIEDRTIEIRALAREAGYRSKMAVSSVDSKVDCVGACVGVRGSRIKQVIEELNGERIDIVRWNDSLQVLIPNALQPAQISEVFTYPRLGRALVLVSDDQLSLAIGRRGQNVRLASKLVGWDIEIMTHEELGEGLERAERWFAQLPHLTEEMIPVLIAEGFLSYNDLTFIDGEALTEITGLPLEQAEETVEYAEEYAETMDRSVEEERRANEVAQAEAARAEAEAEAQARMDAEAAAEAGEIPGDVVDGEVEAAANIDAAAVSEDGGSGGDMTPPADEMAAGGPAAGDTPMTGTTDEKTSDTAPAAAESPV